LYSNDFAALHTGQWTALPHRKKIFLPPCISERLAHKNWKARVNAYEALIKTFQTTASDTDPAFKPYINHPDLLKKIATDSNAVAQEKGLECLVALVKFSGETSAKTRDTVIRHWWTNVLGQLEPGRRTMLLSLITIRGSGKWRRRSCGASMNLDREFISV
jgi:cytoskeleton-associated protein 5